MNQNRSSITRFLKTCNGPVQKCIDQTDGAKYAINALQEGHPYTLDKTIVGENIYNWNLDFIDRVMLSFSTTIVQNFSRMERDLFDRYRNFYIYGTSSVLDDDVKKLDEYIGTIGTDK